jgi:hypothetical protein
MSFDTQNGTHGARQPTAGLLFRSLNTMMMNRIRRKGGKIMGFNALVLTTVGRKSGAKRTTPVAWFPGADDSYLIVASANGGAKKPGLVLQPRRPSGSSPDRNGRSQARCER